MKKLRLDPDALRVQSFTTHAQADRVGTVRGHDSDPSEQIGCTAQCPATVGLSCGYSCLGCTATHPGGTAVMSCRAADCTHED